MRRLAVLLAFLLAFPAHAQIMLTGVGSGNAGGAGATFPGDIVSGAQAWYGLRAYSSSQLGGTTKAVRVTRSSDSEQCDFLITTLGALGNTANCTGADNGEPGSTFCANWTTPASSTCLVNTWYDQSGNGRNVLQATAANQARLGVTGSTVVTFWNHGQEMDLSSLSLSPSSMTISFVANRTGQTTVYNDVIDLVMTGSHGQDGFNNTANNTSTGNGSELVASASDNALHAHQGVFNGSSSVVNNDGTETTGTIASLVSVTEITVGAFSSGGASGMTGYISEVGVWFSAFSGAQRTSMCHNQFNYWATTASC